MSRPRLLVALIASVAALAFAGCGNKEEEYTFGGTEGTYVTVDGLKYQVQISRILNPSDVEDQGYLRGISEGVAPGADEVWFAVFMRVENDGDKAERAATDYLITDTQGNRYRPLSFAPVNSFAYRGGGLMLPTEILPKPDSPAGQGSIQGALLLFKIPTRNLENRPLELSIRTPAAPGKVATVDLDI